MTKETGTLSPVEIGAVIMGVGWGSALDSKQFPAWFDTALAVCLAESGGNTSATHKNTNGTIDYGLWQINSVHRERFRTQPTGADLWPDRLKATTNTLMAKTIWMDTHSFNAWSAYKSGAYKSHTGQGEKIYKQLLKDGNATNIPDAQGMSWQGLLYGPDVDQATVKGVNKVNDVVGGAIGKILTFLKDAGISVGVFGLGLLLIVLGIWFIISQTKTGKVVKGAVETAVAPESLAVRT